MQERRTRWWWLRWFWRRFCGGTGWRRRRKRGIFVWRRRLHWNGRAALKSPCNKGNKPWRFLSTNNTTLSLPFSYQNFYCKSRFISCCYTAGFKLKVEESFSITLALWNKEIYKLIYTLAFVLFFGNLDFQRGYICKQSRINNRCWRRNCFYFT